MAEPVGRFTANVMNAPSGSLFLEGYPSEITGRIIHRLRRPARVDRGTEHNPAVNSMAAYVEALQTLGLEDPTEAVEHWARCRKLRRSTVAVKPAPPKVPASTIAGVAAGAVDPGDVEATVQDQDAIARERAARREAIQVAGDQAKGLAWKALYEGHEAVFDMFRGVIGQALASPYDYREAERWALAHKTIHRLRGGMLPGAEGARLLDYTLARPDLAWQWLMAEAGGVKHLGNEVQDIDDKPYCRVFRYPKKAPAFAPIELRICAEHPEWGPGLYTAAEVVTAADTFAPRQLVDHLLLLNPGHRVASTGPARPQKGAGSGSVGEVYREPADL